MPQSFKFVLLLFDMSVEKFQVRPLDSRILSIYGKNKPSDEICYFVSIFISFIFVVVDLFQIKHRLIRHKTKAH